MLSQRCLVHISACKNDLELLASNAGLCLANQDPPGKLIHAGQLNFALLVLLSASESRL